MLSQFFILSARGDTIITRDFRGDLAKGTNEVFFHQVKFWKGEAPPAFNVEGINFLYLRRNGLYLVATSQYNVAPSFVFSMLLRLVKVVKDFCGVLTEESIRKNFVLVYEVIDELIDFGYPQSTSTEQVRPFIVNDPIAVESAPMRFKPSFLTPNTVPSTEVQRPLSSKKNKNEIFVDVFEKVSVLFNSSGYVINSSIEGCIQMKSYLTGNPQLRLALNEDIVVGRANARFGSVVLDDVNFHESVNTSEFEDYKILSINPPDGEFAVMNYRVTGDYQVPFRIFPFIEELTNYKVEMSVKIRACFPQAHYGANVVVRVNLPKHTNSVTFELPKGLRDQKSEFLQSEKVAEWTIKKLAGETEHIMKLRVSLSAPATSKEVGPVSLQFEIPMYNVSALQIKYLRIADLGKGYNPYRWVRYVTQASSYVSRV
jgi:AP-4 complex subunit mu-1